MRTISDAEAKKSKSKEKGSPEKSTRKPEVGENTGRWTKEEHEMFHACLALLDSRMRTVKSKNKVHTTERIAIMASLTLARDFLSSGKASDVSVEKKLEHLEGIINEALTPQEKLFE